MDRSVTATSRGVTPALRPVAPLAARRGAARRAAVRVHAARPRRTVDEVREAKVITAIKTPYHENGLFDLPSFDHLLETQVAGGANGVVVGGTTGEGQLMSWDEHVMLIAHAVNGWGAHLAVVGNTGSNSTREALHASEQGFNVGMDAALHINPYYGKTSVAGLRSHFTHCLDVGPSIIYNVPARTAQDIPESLVRELAAHPNLIGIKECTGNERIARTVAAGIPCWSGNDDEAHDAVHDANAVGTISVASNIAPAATRALLERRDPDLVRRLQPLWAWLFCEPNPIAVDTALMMMGLVKPVFRLPYVPLSRDKREEGKRILDEIRDLLIPFEGEIKILEDEDFVVLPKY